MSAKWLDRTEQVLLLVLSGFVFWPNAIPSIALITLTLLRLIRDRKSLPGWTELALLTPALIMIAAWEAHGSASDGVREMQLWPTWLAALVYFKTSPFRSWFIRCFAWVSVLQALVLLGVLAFGEPFESGGFSFQVRDAIEHQFNVHPTFLSAAWSWAALLLLFELKPVHYLRWLSAIVLIGTAALCGGKMPILALAITGMLGLVIKSQWAVMTKWIAAAGMALALVALLATPTLRERASELTTLTIDYQEGDLLNSSQLRLGVWNCAWEVTTENWVLGVGPGNTRATLEACYENYQQVEFFQGEYNTHNQFLHFWLCAGILGFMGFIAFCIWLIYIAAKRGNTSLLLFLAFFFLIALTENYFSRQFGMMLWSFFVGSMFYHHRHHQPLGDTPPPSVAGNDST